jgi:hypothetical protein
MPSRASASSSAQLPVVERGDDQQDAVGAQRARLGHLVGSMVKSLRSTGSAQAARACCR